ncbi:hypothetical protein BIW11_10226 [Tropilaelaps mercedesae]|uniref:Uncharacterized protein n=1 Tax=Tropilaelaps mercedesae TaxID=418985 RepID=A0A1V9XGN3_9ACAR|nr:hypothetical protein BIW11_10226 [Tropilaelaps mercedesae]
MQYSSLLLVLIYMYIFLESLGFIFDKCWFAPHFEALRCVIFFLMQPIFLEVYSVKTITSLQENLITISYAITVASGAVCVGIAVYEQYGERIELAFWKLALNCIDFAQETLHDLLEERRKQE